MEPEYIHTWEHDGRTVTFTWLGTSNARPDRVYVFAFTYQGDVLLVTNQDWSPKCWLPGGGVELAETPEVAIRRELREEANATCGTLTYLGTQRADSQDGISFQSFYYSRVKLAPEFEPKHEVTERHLVRPGAVLDRLFWGRSDPKASMLLARALELDRTTS